MTTNVFNHNQHVKISLITLKVSAVYTVQQYPKVIKFHEAKLKPVSESKWYTNKRINICLRNINIIHYHLSFDNSNIFVVTYQFLRNFRSDGLS